MMETEATRESEDGETKKKSISLEDLGKGKVSLRATWEQGGRDRFKSKEGFKVSKRKWKGSQQGTSKGRKKGNCTITYIVNLRMCI
jgi:hypothetical protein